MTDAGADRDESLLSQAAEGDRPLTAEDVAVARDAIGAGDRGALLDLIADLHDADVADLLEQLGHAERGDAVRLLGSDLAPDVLYELDEDVRDDVVEAMKPADLAAAARELDPEDVVYLVEDLESHEQDAVLDALEPVDRTVVEQSLRYPEDSVGRMMRRDFVTAAPFWTVGRMIDAMRADDDLPDEFHDIILVDPMLKPVGLVPLSRVMGSGRDRPLSDLARDETYAVEVEDPQEDVAYAFNKYHVPSAPVVDKAGRLVGVVIMEDAIEALDEEADEDIKRLAGVGDESLTDRIFETAKARLSWLSVSLVAALLAATVITQFEGVIAEATALAVLMPVIAAMGGNAGTQTLTVTVRALATRDLTAANARRILGRELAVGLINGVAFGAVISAIGIAYYGDLRLGLTIALSMIVTLFAAALAGILAPMGLQRIGVDPAIASGPFVTTTVDVAGFFVFLGLATVLMF